jgi:hypothetical protein
MSALHSHPLVRGKLTHESIAGYCTGRQLRCYAAKVERRNEKSAPTGAQSKTANDSTVSKGIIT